MLHGSAITFQTLTNTLGQIGAQREVALRDTISGLGDSASTGDLLVLQQRMQEWTMFTQLQSTVVKELSDAMKGIIQKAA